MTTFALAYSIEDEAAARQITDDLNQYVSIQHYAIKTGGGRSVLASLLDTYEGLIVPLISNNFLRNENCLYGSRHLLLERSQVLPVGLSVGAYDDATQEVIHTFPDLSEPAVLESFAAYWTNRLAALEEALAAHGEAAADAVSHVERVREVVYGIVEIMDELGEETFPTTDSLVANDYEPLFVELNDHAAFERFLAANVADFQELPGLTNLPQVPTTVKRGGGGLRVHPAELEAVPPTEEQPVNYDVDAETQAQVWVAQAWELYEDDDAEAGLELLATGKERLPDYPDVAYNYALMLAMDSEAPQVALLELDKLLEEFHDHAGALFLSGELSLLIGDYNAANLDWLQLKDVDPLYPELNYRLGTLISEHFPERGEEALNYLKLASGEEPPNADARYRLAMLLFQQSGNEKKAIKWLKRAISVNPEHAAAHYALATLHFSRGKVSEARSHFQNAVLFNPGYGTNTNLAAFGLESKDLPDPASRQSAEREERQPTRLATKSELARPSLQSTHVEETTEVSTFDNDAKIVFISGATSGIGRATAELLAKEGYRLILLGRRTERLEELRQNFAEQYGSEVVTISADVRQRQALRKALVNLPDEWKAVDVLINNAGKAKGFDPIHEGDYAHWDEMIDVNLKGLLTLTREVTPWMVQRGRGTIINVCSTAGKEVYPNGNVYCATKHAVDALTYAMRLDLVKHGIRVGQICPAHVEETEFAVVRFDGDVKRAKIYEDFQPLRSADVAAAIRFMVEQPPHVNIMDLVLQGTQQASSTVVDRSGRNKFQTPGTDE